MSRDEQAYRKYVEDCKAKELPAAKYTVWMLITQGLGWRVVGT